MAEDTTAAPASDAPKSGNKLVLILTAVNIVLSLGMVAVLLISFKKEATQPRLDDINPTAEEAAAEAAKGEGGEAKPQATAQSFGKILTLEQFTVNLSSVGTVNPKFVRVNISLEVPTADTESEIGQKMPQVRNTVIDLFNSKRPSDIATPEGRNYLKEELKNAINSFLVTGKVKGVFFTSFAVSG